MVGQTLAHYKILEKIGSGGMGDVYLAEDTKLDRKVALKVLPSELAENEERRARFQREAKAIAALDHPNIVQVFSVEEADGTHFITMQLVRGKTLTELLPKHGFPLNKFFEITIPLADAVAAAHQEGITHRDLKPDNMMVSDDGRVKVLDFGLAKPTSGFVGGDADSALPTAAKTAEGVIVGTLNYMSPEQAQGKTVDARSDIFSLGVVFYEMLTGRRPFTGETPAEILSSIIKDTPDSTSDLNPTVPRDLAKLVKRCLAKDPIRRYQSAIDLRNELEETKQEVESGEAFSGVLALQPKSARRWSRRVGIGSVLALLLIAGTLSYLKESSRLNVPRLADPIQITSDTGIEDYPAWSPSGDALAYEFNESDNWDIWLTQVGRGPPLNRTPDHAGSDRFPSFSRDGNQIAFLSDRDGLGVVVMPLLTGPPRRVANVDTWFGAPQWSQDGTKLGYTICEGTECYFEIVSLRASSTQRFQLPGQGARCWDPSWSTDERFVACVDATVRDAQVTRLVVLRLSDGETFTVTSRTNARNPSWSPDGRALYFVSNRGGSMDLWSQPMARDGGPTGEAQPVTAGVGIRAAAFSQDGKKLAYSKGRSVANLWRVSILRGGPATWADAEQLTFDQAFLECVDVSPDGSRLLFSSDRAGNQDIWMMSLADRKMQQLTTDPGVDQCPAVSPNGIEVAFYSDRSGNNDVWVVPLSGGSPRQLTHDEGHDKHPSWSPDGRTMAFDSDRNGNRDIWVVPAEGGDARALTDHPAMDRIPQWSPDGEWVYFESNRSGQFCLWRVPLGGGEPEIFSRDLAWLNSDDVLIPQWSRDGNRMYFMGVSERAGNLWELTVEDGTVRALSDLQGKRGVLEPDALATDGDYMYFSWAEDLGDIWVMDVVTDEDK